MTGITPEAVAKGLTNLIDESDPVIAGQECVIEFAESQGSELTFTVTGEDRTQRHYVATVRDADEPGVLHRLKAAILLNSPGQAVEKCRAIIADALEGES
jgi:hypothetical protein